MNLDEATKKYLTDDFRLKGEFLNDQYKDEVMTRATRYAGWTLPTIFPDDNLVEHDEMQNDYQSVGAQAVTHLANKIMMALFQPSRPFFRMQLTQEQRKQVIASGMSEAQLEAAMSEAERAGMRELNKLNARVTLTDVIIHLIITGNALLHTPKDENLQCFSLRDYTTKRDLGGNTIKIITRETKSVSGLPDDLAAIALSNGYYEKDDVSIYTGVCKVAKDRFIIWQELEDICYCHKQIGFATKDELEYIPLTWNLVRGKDYGTGLVENYAGDFHSLSTLAESILDYTTLITDVKNLVDPAGMTDVRELTQSPSGAYVHGREEDIFVHAPQVTNVTDFLTKQFETVSRRIGAAFLLNTAVTRDAERVTAEEIRMQAHELEASLGGVYSRLAGELQLPLAKRLLRKLDKLFKDIEPIIVTGLESLSRNSELDQLRFFFQDLIALSELPPEAAKRVDYGNLIAMLGSGHGVEYKKFLKDEATVQKETKEAMQRQAAMAGMEEQAKVQGQQQ